MGVQLVGGPPRLAKMSPEQAPRLEDSAKEHRIGFQYQMQYTVLVCIAWYLHGMHGIATTA